MTAALLGIVVALGLLASLAIGFWIGTTREHRPAEPAPDHRQVWVEARAQQAERSGAWKN